MALFRMSHDSSNPAIDSGRTYSSEPRKAAQGASRAAEDAVLLERLVAGDPQAMAAIFDRYSGIVYSVALRVLKDPAQAEDVMQDIFIQVWKNPASFVSGRGSLGAWLAVVARNRSIDCLRRRRPTDSVEDVVLAASTDLASESERNLLMEQVRVSLLQLPPEQRKSVEMAYFEGLSHSEISEQTGDALGTVKTRIRLGLISLRKAMQGKATQSKERPSHARQGEAS